MYKREELAPKLENTQLGKYRVLEKIGVGMRNTVYLAHDPFIDRKVAIKVAHPHLLRPGANRELYKKKFFNEAQIAGTLKHPNITSIFDAGSDNDFFYIVMEYVPGGKILADYCKANKLLPLSDVVTIAYKCATAIDYSHKRGIVHRDINPRHVLLTEEKEPKISDFSIAIAHLQPDSDILEHTGSPSYMSPEQSQGLEPSPKSDIFSLGIVMYELITGKNPLEMDGRAGPPGNYTKPRPLKSYRNDVPEILDRIVLRALANNPNNRYKTGMDLAGDLSLVFDFLDQHAERVSNDDKFRTLRDHSFFKGFPDNEIWEIINTCRWEVVERDRRIILDSDCEKALYVIISGSVCVSKNQVDCGILKRGDCFGQMGFLSGEKHSASFRAKDEVTILEIPAPVIEQLSLQCQLRFHKVFVHTLIGRLSANTKTVDLKTKRQENSSSSASTAGTD